MRKDVWLACTSIALGAWIAACTSGDEPKPAAPPPAAAKAEPAPAPAAAPESAAIVPASTDTRGFVVSRWSDEIPREAIESGCPDGLNQTELEHFGITKEELSAAYKKGGGKAADALFPGNGCIDPTSQEDPGWRFVQGTEPVAGMDLDGADGADGACAHRDFPGASGESGIDNQHWRLMGCTAAYRPGGLIDRLYESNSFIKEGGAPILIEMTGVDDPRNDDEVEVRILSSTDPLSIDGTGEVMRDTTMTIDDDPQFQNESARGRIVDGVLVTEPMEDVRIHIKTQTMDNHFHYRDVRIRAEVSEDGSLKGLIGGYWDGDNLFDSMNRQYIGENHVGRIAAISRGYICSGLYHAIPKVADGHPDPETGECTSVSHAVHFEAVPTFVVAAPEGQAES